MRFGMRKPLNMLLVCDEEFICKNIYDSNDVKPHSDRLKKDYFGFKQRCCLLCCQFRKVCQDSQLLIDKLAHCRYQGFDDQQASKLELHQGYSSESFYLGGWHQARHLRNELCLFCKEDTLMSLSFRNIVDMLYAVPDR